MALKDIFDEGIGSDIFGGMFETGAGAARKFNQRNFQQIKDQFLRGRAGMPGLMPFFLKQTGLGLGQMQGAVDEARAGGQRALGALGNQGAAAYRRIDDMTQQGVSMANQRAMSQGLYSGSPGVAAGNQSRYQGQQAVGQLGGQLGQLFANQQTRNSAMTMNALQGLAQYYAQRAQGFGQLGAQLGGLQAQFQAQPGQSFWSANIAPILGGAAGAAAGGGFG